MHPNIIRILNSVLYTEYIIRYVRFSVVNLSAPPLSREPAHSTHNQPCPPLLNAPATPSLVRRCALYIVVCCLTLNFLWVRKRGTPYDIFLLLLLAVDMPRDTRHSTLDIRHNDSSIRKSMESCCSQGADKVVSEIREMGYHIVCIYIHMYNVFCIWYV